MVNKGATKGSSTPNRRFTRFGKSTANWEDVDGELIKATIVAAALTGGALRFGYTSDGGAYALGIYGDGDKPYTEYVRPSEDIDAVLRDIEAAFLDIRAAQQKKTP